MSKLKISKKTILIVFACIICPLMLIAGGLGQFIFFVSIFVTLYGVIEVEGSDKKSRLEEEAKTTSMLTPKTNGELE